MLYLDTSALAKLVFAEPESAALDSFLADRELAISGLSRTELRRVVLRRSPQHMSVCEQLLSVCYQVAVTAALLDRAGTVKPADLRSLDAIHLVSALTLAEAMSGFVAYDKRLVEAAGQVGLPVASPH